MELLNSISYTVAAIDNFRAAHPAQTDLSNKDVPELASNSHMAAHHAELATYLIDGLSGYQLKLDALTQSQCERVTAYIFSNQDQFWDMFLNGTPVEFTFAPECAPSNTLSIVKR